MARFVVVVAVFVVVLVAVTSAQTGRTSLCRLLRRGQCESVCGQGRELVVTKYNLCPNREQCCVKKAVVRPPPSTPTVPLSWWGSWSPCSATCGNGEMRRECLSEDISLCKTKVETKPCPDLPPCHSAKWQDWGQWGSCSTECGEGVQTRKIACTKPDGQLSTDCPCFGNYITEKRRSCNTHPCPDRECGWRRGDKPTFRVVNGQPSAPCSWPWAVAFRMTLPAGLPPSSPPAVTICSGVLVSPRYVLTTATCLNFANTTASGPLTLTLHLGDINMNLVDEGEFQVQSETSMIHPDFTDEGLLSKNNLALMKLTYPVYSADCHRPVCLMDSLLTPLDTSKPMECVVAGFGPTNASVPEPSMEMHEANVTMLPANLCSIYNSNFPSDSDLLCSLMGNSRRACANDEGSFLVCRHQGGQWVLRGVDVGLSASVECPPFTPDYYVDVGKHLPWIRGIIGKR